MAKPNRFPLHATLFVTQIAFASLAVEGKIAMAPPRSVSPFALAMTRILAGAIVFAIAARLARAPRVSSWADRGRLAMLSLFGIVINQALFLAGLSRTSPMSATLLVATIPVFTAAVAAIAGRGRITLRTAAGIALAILGIATLSGFKLPLRGDLFVMLNAASYAIYVVFAKDVLTKYGTWTVMAWVFGCGAFFFAPLGGLALVHDAPLWSASARWFVAYVVLVPTVIAYWLSGWALRRATPTLVTIYVYLQPIFVAVLAYLQLGQPVTLTTLLAGALIFGGVTVVASAQTPLPDYTEAHGSIRRDGPDLSS